MRVLFTVFAHRSHFFCTVPIAWALSSAGHEVCVASQPDLTEPIRRAGLTAVPVGSALNLMARAKQKPSEKPGYGTGFNMAETRPETLTWDYLKGVFRAYSLISESVADQEMLDDLVRFSRQWRPDLVIWDAMTYAGAIAARSCGAAHARTLFGLDHWARIRGLFLTVMNEQPPDSREDPLRDWLRRRLARYNCDFNEEIVLGQRTIDPVLPSWMFFPVDVNYLPARFIPYNGPAVVHGSLYEPPRRPRVILTLGQSLPHVRNDSFPVSDILTSVAALDIDLIATLNSEQFTSLSSVPDNVRLVDFIPLNEILPSCSAIIHHGGTGTIANAIVHGTPQLIVPGWLWDEAGAAQRLADRGMGLMIDPAEFSAARSKSDLARLLDEPSFRENCAQVRKELLATPTPQDIVPELEELAAQRRQ